MKNVIESIIKLNEDLMMFESLIDDEVSNTYINEDFVNFSNDRIEIITKICNLLDVNISEILK